MLYYSTNPCVKTVYSILKERKAQFVKRTSEWEDLNKMVSKNWDTIVFNAYLLQGQTEGLGFKVFVNEADYWAPTRVWVVSSHTAFELHRMQSLKKINDVKIDKCLSISKKNWAFVKIMLNALIHG